MVRGAAPALGRLVFYLMIEVVTHASNGTGVGIDGLGLQAFELEVFEMGFVALIESRWRLGSCWCVLARYCRIIPSELTR